MRSDPSRPVRRSASEAVELVAGLRFTEGPSLDRAGRLYFSEIPAGRIWRRTTSGELQVFLQAKAPNGTAVHPNGDVYFCEGDLRLIGVAHPDGTWEELIDQVDGMPLRGPNDCTFGDDGTLYFSDPTGSSMDPSGAGMGSP